MKTIEAISVLNLTKEINSIDEVKKSYRKLSMKYHPDVNPSGENMMKMINEAYEHLSALVYPLHFQSDEEINQTILEDYENILSKLFTFKNINIELCGTWIWVTGETKEVKEELKELGLFYAKNKVAWYYTKSKKLFYRGKRPSLDDIRSRFGSQGIKEKQHKHYALA